jgi:flavin-dependent dehydrogenase
MKTDPAAEAVRSLKTETLKTDFVIVGGGVAGTCAAIAAARSGMKTVLIQDRPVLGGNGSSEVRLWWLGATCHGMTNNRWAREPGIVNELMMENLYRNPDGNPVLVDLTLLDKVKQ